MTDKIEKDVIIVSKTHMEHGVCVGGILGNGELVRLLKKNGFNQDKDTLFSIGDVYTIEFQKKPNLEPPHVEDVLVLNAKSKDEKLSAKEIVNLLKSLDDIKIWEGDPSKLFDGKVNWEPGGSGCIKRGSLPSNSVGFWVSDEDLICNNHYYFYKGTNILLCGNKKIKYVGCESEIDVIPAGTLIRLSLARWWIKPNCEPKEEACYLQLSGWYEKF